MVKVPGKVILCDTEGLDPYGFVEELGIGGNEVIVDGTSRFELNAFVGGLESAGSGVEVAVLLVVVLVEADLSSRAVDEVLELARGHVKLPRLILPEAMGDIICALPDPLQALPSLLFRYRCSRLSLGMPSEKYYEIPITARICMKIRQQQN